MAVLPLPSGHNIVLVGAWNIRIFSPEWVAMNLAKLKKEVQLEVAVGNPVAPIKLSFDSVELRVGAGRLVVAARDLTDVALLQVRDAAVSVLTMLSHTPVSAIGVNFQYRVSNPPSSLLDVFVLSDAGPWSDFDARLKTTSIHRKTSFQGRGLDILLDLTPEGDVLVEFNNNTAIKSAADALAFLGGDILAFREDSKTALATVYGIQPHEDT